MNCFFVDEQFLTRVLQKGEPVDVYLADLQRLVAHMKGDSANPLLNCPFMTGLPFDVIHTASFRGQQIMYHRRYNYPTPAQAKQMIGEVGMQGAYVHDIVRDIWKVSSSKVCTA